MSFTETPTLSDGAPATCANCGAALTADQHYCLACGHPCSPVRLAFLDVLHTERQSAREPSAAIVPARAGYAPPYDAPGATASLRRYSGLFGLLTTLLLAVLCGLLVGHWVSQSRAPAQQLVKVEYPDGVPALAAQATPTTGATTTQPQPARSSTQSSAKKEAAEAKEVQAAEEKPPPAPVKASTKTLQRLANSKGRKHEREVEKLGDQPIETGGGASESSGSGTSENSGGGTSKSSGGASRQTTG